MIRDRNAQTLFMNFDNIVVYGGRPSDIDFIYIVPNWYQGAQGFLILAEIKHESGVFQDGQRSIYEELLNNYNNGGAIFYLTHKCKWQNGDTQVDVADCNVEEFYYKGKWQKPQKPISFNEALPKLIQHHINFNW